MSEKENSKESSKEGSKEINPHYVELMGTVAKLRELTDTVMSGLLESEKITEGERIVLVAGYIVALKPSSGAAEMVFKEMTARLKTNE
jgi:hypothetical protein